MKATFIKTIVAISTVLVLLLIRSAAYCHQQEKPFFELDSLFLVSGELSGSNDCSAKVRCFSDSSALTVEVTVIDDSLMFSKDSSNSDHIEMWLFENNFSDYEPLNPQVHYKFIPMKGISAGDKSFYWYSGSNHLHDFKKAINDPVITIQPDFGSAETVTYKKLLQRKQEWDPVNEIDEYFRDAKTLRLKNTDIFWGLTHIGFLPQQKKAIIYNSDSYASLEKNIGVKILHPMDSINISFQKINGGYKIKARILPEAIGFATSRGIQSLRFIIDVFDIDGVKSQKKILSTSLKRDCLNRNTYTVANLGKEQTIKVNISEKIPEIGNIDNSNIGDLIRDIAPFHYTFTIHGWVPIQPIIESLDAVHDRYSDWREVRDFMKFFFRLNPINIDFSDTVIGAHNVRFIIKHNQRWLVLDNELLKQDETVHSTFLLPDSSIGILSSKYSTTEGYTMKMTSFFFTSSSSIDSPLLLVDYDSDSLYFPANNALRYSRAQINEEFDYIYSEESGFPWEEYYEWEKEGSSIIITPGENIHVRVSWDEHGRNIRSELLH